MQPCGGIVLCGGRSSRMGMSKAMLPFGPERMLQRVVRLLGEAVAPIVVVASENQTLPELPIDVAIVRDEREARGPLEGLRVGMVALAGQAEWAYATSCDVPLLKPSLVRRIAAWGQQGYWRIAVPRAEGFDHPLAAVYSLSLLPVIEQAIEQDRLRLTSLLDEVATLRIAASQLRQVDPELDSLRNLNRPEDYLAALDSAGLRIEPQVAAELRLRVD